MASPSPLRWWAGRTAMSAIIKYQAPSVIMRPIATASFSSSFSPLSLGAEVPFPGEAAPAAELIWPVEELSGEDETEDSEKVTWQLYHVPLGTALAWAS